MYPEGESKESPEESPNESNYLKLFPHIYTLVIECHVPKRNLVKEAVSMIKQEVPSDYR